MGVDKVLIGASSDNTGATDAGSAYLFSTSGALLITFNNPAPASGDSFGNAVAAVGTDKLLIGAFQDDVGTTDSGAAYLFTLGAYLPGLIPDPSIGGWLRSGLNISYSGGNVGIGTASPQQPLHVNGTIRWGGTTANYAYSGEDGSGLFVEQHGVSVATSRMRLQSSKSGNFLDYAQLNIDPNIGFSFLGQGSGNAKVGIGRSAAANALEVEGNASKTTAGSWLANSDARIKTDVQTLTGALDKLAQVRLVQFRYTGEYRAQHPSLKDRSYLNVVAQEFQKVFPEDVQSSGEKLPVSGDAILQVDTYPLTIYSAAAIQELNEKVESGKQKAETRVEKLEAENAELRARLEKLERLLNNETKTGAK